MSSFQSVKDDISFGSDVTVTIEERYVPKDGKIAHFRKIGDGDWKLVTDDAQISIHRLSPWPWEDAKSVPSGTSSHSLDCMLRAAELMKEAMAMMLCSNRDDVEPILDVLRPLIREVEGERETMTAKPLREHPVKYSKKVHGTWHPARKAKAK